MSKYFASALLLTLVTGYYLSPSLVQAKTVTPTVFLIDKTLSEQRYVNGPTLEELQKNPQRKPTPQTKVGNSQTTKKVSYGCSCVLWVKAQIGYTKSIGAARNWPINSNKPQIGAVIITYESGLGHVGLVTGFDDQYITISEANYTRCRVTHGRKLALSSKLIKGYYIP